MSRMERLCWAHRIDVFERQKELFSQSNKDPGFNRELEPVGSGIFTRKGLNVRLNAPKRPELASYAADKSSAFVEL